jgi:hypothetical protein
MKIPIILKFYFLSRYQPKQFCGWLFLSYANGIPLNTLETSSYGSLNSGAQQAFLAYNAFVIDPANADSNNTVYNSNVPGGETITKKTRLLRAIMENFL